MASKIAFQTKGEILFQQTKGKKKFISSKPALQEILKEILQAEQK